MIVPSSPQIASSPAMQRSMRRSLVEETRPNPVSSKMEVTIQETCLLLRIMIPMMLKFYFSCGVSNMASAFIGHYDKKPEHIAGALLGKTYSNVTGLSIGVGLTLGVATFASQNHGRSANKENGFMMRQCRSALILAAIFSTLCAVFTKPILRALGQPEPVIDPCYQFTLVNLISLPALWYSGAIGTALVSQGIVNPPVVFDVISASINMGLTFVFLRFAGIGFIGAAWANVIASWFTLVAVSTYVLVTKKQDTVWLIPTLDAGSPPPLSLSKYLAVALPSAFSLWAEWWAGEIQAMLAGRLPGGEMSVGGNGLIFTTLAIFYMTFVAAQSAATTRVGNLVGAKQASNIAISIGTAVTLSMILSGGTAILLQIYGKSVLSLYTDEPGILAEAFKANLGMVLSIPPYAVMMCLLGALRGAGLQAWGAVVLAIAFYLFGIPSSAYLALYTDLGLLGIWLGNAIGMTLAAVAMGIRIVFVDWEKVVQDASTAAELQDPLQAQS